MACEGLLLHAQSRGRHPGSIRLPASSSGEYTPNNPEYVTEYVGNLTTNRHIAVCGRRVIGASVGNHVFALDAQTGRLAWETTLHDYTQNPAICPHRPSPTAS